jgi:hypothetical protein
MQEMMKMISERSDQIEEPLFDMLASLGDFMSFKELMLENLMIYLKMLKNI